MKRTIYRVRRGFPGAGQFAKASSWRRSKAHGGTRYVRQRIEVKPKPKVPAKPIALRREVEDREARAERRRARMEEKFVAEEEIEKEFKPLEWEASADYEEPE